MMIPATHILTTLTNVAQEQRWLAKSNAAAEANVAQSDRATDASDVHIALHFSLGFCFHLEAVGLEALKIAASAFQ